MSLNVLVLGALSQVDAEGVEKSSGLGVRRVASANSSSVLWLRGLRQMSAPL